MRIRECYSGLAGIGGAVDHKLQSLEGVEGWLVK